MKKLLALVIVCGLFCAVGCSKPATPAKKADEKKVEKKVEDKAAAPKAEEKAAAPKAEEKKAK
jgi:hypothetical protein